MSDDTFRSVDIERTSAGQYLARNVRGLQHLVHEQGGLVEPVAGVVVVGHLATALGEDLV